MKQIRIVSNDGTSHNAKITDTETGEEIPHVYRVELTLDASAATTATLYTYLPVTDVVVNAAMVTVKQKCPYCGGIVDATEQVEVNAQAD